MYRSRVIEKAMQHKTNEYWSSLSKIFNERTSLCLNVINGERGNSRSGAGVIGRSSLHNKASFFVLLLGPR